MLSPALRLLAGAFLLGLSCEAEPLTWLTNKTEVFNRATDLGQRILLVAGRDGCSTCINVSNFCELEESPPIKPLIRSEYVPWHENIDTGTNWQVYAAGLTTFTLPLMVWIDPAYPTNYLYRLTGQPFVSTFYTALYNRASFTNAVINRIEWNQGQPQLSISRLTYGASVQIERSPDPADPQSWTALDTFTSWSKTTNWPVDGGGLPRAFYRVTATR